MKIQCNFMLPNGTISRAVIVDFNDYHGRTNFYFEAKEWLKMGKGYSVLTISI